MVFFGDGGGERNRLAYSDGIVLGEFQGVRDNGADAALQFKPVAGTQPAPD